ncbi:HD family phosphohydrolase [Alkalibacter mobilis]|uniref:HD family phosphohydrolase n=1 Tax=Alkalibacter mobilis TaxID=2787712 RepID=UPI00189D1016|nr:HDIG domain-containing protein [Alkalibacter mobilis]
MITIKIKEKKSSIVDSTKKTNNSKKFNIQIFTALVGFLLIYAIMVFLALPPNYNYDQGDVATENIFAPTTIVDEKTTEKLKSQAAASVEQIYTKIDDVNTNIKETIEGFFSVVSSQELTEDVITQLRTRYMDLSDVAFESLNSLSSEEINKVENAVLETLDRLYADEINIQDVETKKEEARNLIAERDLYNESLGMEIINKVIQPNMILDVEKTQQAVEDARSKVQTVTYEEGELLVEEGEILSSEKIDLLVSNNMMRNSYLDDPYLIIGVFTLLVTIFGIYYIYLKKFYKVLILNDKSRFAIVVIMFSFMVMMTIPISAFSPYLVPVSMMAMTIALLTDKRLAITTTVFFVIISAFGSNLNIIQIILYLLNGYIGAIGMIKITKRADVLRTGSLVSITNLVLIGSYNLINHNFGLNGIIDMAYGTVNGVISAILTLGTLVIWEYAFDITTPIMLMELANPNHPLLKKLMNNAPGTYHHSIIVGNLAENAAEKIGANSLLVRVGAYYHDIGKSLSPVYFTENQMGDINPHDYISPEKSVQIIKNHVTKGYEMAKEFKIPYEIRNFILTHHGDGAIEFFYHKAVENKENPEIDKFKYEAHRPISKEEGILALADSVEAAVRSIQGINEEKIIDRVEKIFQKKLNDGMLDDCNLSLKEIKTIKEVFIKVLNSVYHQRIEYPEMEEKKES